jgi:rhodanese-related sulfurtransferase
LGGSALSLLISLAALYIAYKYWQRHRLLRELRTARITVAELRQKLDAGEELVILDLRSRAALEQDPVLIRGAIHLNLDDIDERQHEIPRDRDIIVYCSCPNEVSSARVALRLQRKGFTRVRPLLGGIDAWRENNHPVEPRSSVLRSVTGNASSALDADALNLPPVRPLTNGQDQAAGTANRNGGSI